MTRKRQAAIQGFVGEGGQVVASCAAASEFNLTNGHLFSDNEEIIVTAGTQSEAFAPSSGAGAIPAIFGFDGGILVWLDSAFANGAARFCYSSTQGIVADFQNSIVDCQVVTLFFFSST